MSATPQQKNLLARINQLRGLARWYRGNHETASAEAIEWACETIVKLQNDLTWWHNNAAPKHYWPVQGAGEKPAHEPRYGKRR